MARRRHSNRRRRGGSMGFLYKLLSMLVICTAVILALTLFFRVDVIVVTGTEQYTEEQVTEATGVERGDNLILLNKYDVQNRIREQLPYIEWIRINRKLPDTLLVEVVQECRQPLAIVQDGSAWLMSPSGKIVDQKESPAAQQYPVIDGCQLLAPSVGTPMALATEYATQQNSLLELLSALEESEMLDQVDAIHLEDLSVLTMEYAGRFRVEMPYGADYAYKLRALEVVIGKLETNQTGTIQLVRDDGRINFIED